MSDRRDGPEPGSWLEHARADLYAAHVLHAHEDVEPHEVCVLAQQATEKALKAVLVSCGIRVPRTHSLRDLRFLVGENLSCDTEDSILNAMTVSYTAARYPGDWESPTAQDAETGLATACRIVAAVEESLRTRKDAL